MSNYIKGVGMTKFGVHYNTSQEMAYEAVQEALNDANMSMSEVDEVVISKGDSVNDGERQRLYPGVISSIFQEEDIPMVRVTAACCGGGSAFWNAIHSEAKNVLVLGIEKLSTQLTKFVTDDFMMAADRLYEQTEGLNFPAQNALVAQQYMQKYGVTSDDLALVALKNHENAFNNPKAKFFGKKVTMEMINKSPVVASPLRLFDCSISIDGAAAAIITRDPTDIKIIGSSLYASRLPTFESEDMTTWEATRLSSQDAYKQAHLKPADISFAEIHDAFTPVELINYEDLGFAKPGQGSQLIRDGVTKLNGRLPINSSGGLKAKGHPVSATGVSQIYEIVTQMRKKADKRQLDHTKYGLAHNIGGAGSTVTTHIFENIGG